MNAQNLLFKLNTRLKESKISAIDINWIFYAPSHTDLFCISTQLKALSF